MDDRNPVDVARQSLGAPLSERPAPASPSPDAPSASPLRRAASGTFAGLAALAAQLTVQFVSVPVLLRHWSAETYGIWLAVHSLFGLLITLDLGHQNYIGAQLLSRVGVDDEGARRAVQTGVAGAVLLATLETIVAAVLIVSGALSGLVAAPPSREFEVALSLASMLAPWLVFGSMGGVLVRLYAPLGLYARGSWIGLFHRSSVALVAPFVAAQGGGLVQAAVASAIVNGFWSAVVLVDLRRYRRYRPFLTLRFDRRETASNLTGSLVLALSAFVAQLQQHGVFVILGATSIGAEAVALFATIRTIASLLLQGSSTFVAPLAPDLVRAHVTGDVARTSRLIVALGGVGVVLSGVGTAIMLPCAEPLYEMWTGRALRFDGAVFALLAATVAVRLAASPVLTLLQGTNALVAQLLGAVSQTAVTLGAAAIGSRVDGLRGTCAALLFGEVVGSWFVLPLACAARAPAVARSLRSRVALRTFGPSVAIVAVLLGIAFGLVPDLPGAACIGALGLVASAGVVAVLPADVRGRLGSRVRKLISTPSR